VPYVRAARGRRGLVLRRLYAAGASDPQAAVLGKEGYGVCGVRLLIRINNEEFVEELCGHYRRSGFSAERVGGAMIEVTAPTARAADERTQILAHLRVWNLVNPDASAEAVN
jgi:hypothetical protein